MIDKELFSNYATLHFGDINPFVMALSNPTQYAQNYPACDILNGDINCNGQFGFDDINPFVACLTEGACPHYEVCAFCGDGVADPGEDCDDDDLNGQTCQTLGYDSGDLSCNPDCTFNTGQCQQGSGEECTSNDDCTLRCYPTCNVSTGECMPNATVCADFYVEELTYVDPVTGEENWREIDLENEQIEKGLKVKLDAGSFSTHAVRYDWTFPGYYPSGPEVMYQFGIDYTVQLIAYDEDWNEDIITKTIYVDTGMQLLSSMPSPGTVFYPQYYVLDGNTIWVISSNGLIATADVSNPYALPMLQIMPTPALQYKYSISYANGRLYVGTGDGVNVYRADPNDFVLLHRFLASEMGSLSTMTVSSVGDMLYIGSSYPDKLWAYDMSNPEQPTLVSSLDLSLHPSYVIQLANDALLFHASGGTSLALIDIRDAQNPNLSEVIDTGAVLGANYDVVNEYQCVISANNGARMYYILPDIPLNEPLVLSPARVLVTGLGSSGGGLSTTRLYVRNGQFIAKYDITDWAGPGYLMETFEPQAPMGGVDDFVIDPDGPLGPASGILYVGYSFGYRAFEPS
ncbi:MAG: hypothetical protein KKD18_01995 [Nanoarchaeota archaeon]|nr:hypothetical protein [Nanoarchaeota archaeon]